MIQPAFEILNQRGTPMFFSDVFANRPTAGVVGRIFISTDTYAFYRDTGSGWDLIGGPGTGTITGSGTIGTLPIWNGTQVIGDSSLLEGASKFTTTKDFQADGYYLSGMTAGSGALYWTSDRVTLANYNPTGDVHIEVAGGQAAQVVLGSNLSTTFYGNIIRNGGLSTQFLKADGSLDSSSYVTTNIYNGNGTLSGNRVVTLNSNYLSFAGGQTYIGSQTTSSGLLTINNSNADAHVQVVGANSPSIRIDNAGTGATRRFVIGLSTATNNFIQGSTAGDICISTASASPMLFGMWQTINASEVMRITTANNLLVGTSVDGGYKVLISGSTSPFKALGNNGNAIILNPSYNYYDAYNHVIRSLNGTTTFATIDNLGNLGLGVTPSAWGFRKSLQIAVGGALSASTDPAFAEVVEVSGNRYIDGSAVDRYITNGVASMYQQFSGQHRWYTAPSGTAGNAISFTQAMTLTSTGNLLVGTTTDNGAKIQVNGTGTILGNVSIGTSTLSTRLTVIDSSNSFAFTAGGNSTTPNLVAIGTISSIPSINGYTNSFSSVTDLSLQPNGGNLLVGSTSNPGQKLYLNGSLRIDGQRSGTAGGASGQHLIINCDGTTYKIALLNN